MGIEQKYRVVGLLLMSVLVFLLGSLLLWSARKKRILKQHYTSGIKTALVFSFILVMSAWFLRFAVGYYYFSVSTGNGIRLSWWEEVISSFFAAFRTFSFEKEFAEFIVSVKEMLVAVVPTGHWSAPWIRIGVVLYVSLLNLLGPIAGGTLVLEILSSAYPKWKLFCAYIKIGRKKRYFFFSELNPASLALAKSICMDYKKNKPVLIFTDAYIDDKKEKEYEFLLEAKRYGAICVQDDIVHVTKPLFGQKEYYLMDDDEFENFQKLSSLFEPYNIKFVKNSTIYLFVKSDAYIQIEKELYCKIKEEKFFNDQNRPKISPVRSYRNLVHNLLTDVPLYEPLVHKSDKSCLNVTILGNGIIGTEAFLGVYWLGQMMYSGGDAATPSINPCALTVNIISKDSVEAFWSKIDCINPEIRDTIEEIGMDRKGFDDDCLVCTMDGKRNKPYCSVRYMQSDLQLESFWDREMAGVRDMLDSDYFIVALENDSDNISIAEKVRCSIGKTRMEKGLSDSEHHVVIAYAVLNSRLASLLNEQKNNTAHTNSISPVYMHAFGSLEQVYSCKNVYMSMYSVLADEIEKSYNIFYNKLHQQANQQRIGSDIGKYESKNYTHWANLARSMHMKYKVFSIGWINTSLFDYATENDRKEYHYNHVKNQCDLYRMLSTIRIPEKLTSDYQERFKDLELKKHCLAWLEHRRWNAFTRTMGYQNVNIKSILRQKGTSKDMNLRLHACLVEAQQPDVAGDNQYMLNDYTAETPRDFLDVVSVETHSVDPNSYDYKKYDYYQFELDGFREREELHTVLKNRKVFMPSRYCNPKRYKDAICCSTLYGKTYLLPVEKIKRSTHKDVKHDLKIDD